MVSLPHRVHRPRIIKRNGRMSFRLHKFSPMLVPMIVSSWNGVYSTTIPQAPYLHNPSYTYGKHFDQFTFIPTIYTDFLSTRTRSPASSQSPLTTLSQIPLCSTDSPVAFNVNQPSSTPIVIDSGATFGTTPFVDDLIPGTIEHIDLSVQNLSGSSAITARGFGRWVVEDIHGNRSILEPYLHVVPSSSVRLFSPQDYIKGLNGGSYRMTPKTSYLTLPNKDSLEIPYHHSNGLPMIFQPISYAAARNHLNFDDLTTAAIHMNVADERNQNLCAASQELVLKHRLCSHANTQWCQELMRTRTFKNEDGTVSTHPPILKTKHPRTRSVTPCACAGCALGKLNRRPPKSSVVKDKSEMSLKVDQLSPGERVFVDQYDSSVHGRRYDSYGKESSHDKYIGGTLFYDAMSTLIHITHQTTTCVSDTLASKHSFESFAATSGVHISAYRADNHIFNAKGFLDDCAALDQVIDFCGVGAHFQNAAERAIQTITTWARTLIIDAAIHWPDEVDLDLWPMAMDHAVWVWNHLPKQGVGFSPMELFTGVRSDHSSLNRLHVWGCPMYVLDPKLHVSGGSIPKWSKRSRLGQFLGFSPHHSTNVALVRNVRTGSITPQFHAIFDDMFHTVSTTFNDPVNSLNDVFSTDEWQTLVQSGSDRFYTDDVVPPPLHRDYTSTDSVRERESGTSTSNSSATTLDTSTEQTARERERAKSYQDFRSKHPQDAEILADKWTPGQYEELTLNTEECGAQESVNDIHVDLDPLFDADDNDDLSPVHAPSERAQFKDDSSYKVPNDITSSSSAPKRGKRIKSKNQFVWNDDFKVFKTEYDTKAFLMQKTRLGTINNAFINSLDWSSMTSFSSNSHWKRFSSFVMRNVSNLHNTVEQLHPLLLSTKANAEDNPKWFDAMNGPFASQFYEAMVVELTTLEEIGAWTKVVRDKTMNVLKSTWAFKIKRFPNGLVRKFKARYCVRGDMQIEGVDFDETYAPVVNWVTVRTLLILSQQLGLVTAQVDYTAAFPQSDLDQDVYVEMPRGFMEKNMVYKLNKSLYGLRQSPRNFFSHLSKQLCSVGMSPSKADPCLFIGKDCICLTYVDDILIFAKSQDVIDKLVSDLREVGASLTVEDNVAGFLGVDISRQDNGDITMTQTGLIERIVEALGLTHGNVKETPAAQGTLPKNEDGPPCNGTFNYASVIGMLLYLSGHTRPDIAFAVSQCARYSFCPRHSHEEALKRIGRYLKGTRDKGIIMKKSKSLKLDLYVDADFAGQWSYENDMDPTSVKSRSGWLVTIGGSPIAWVSRLQSEISLSTMEAEYVALSSSMKDLLPLKRIVKAVAVGLGLSEDLIATIQSDVWEDNSGALTLAKLEPPRYTPRSKHYALKYHWFRELIYYDNSIMLNKIDTKEQLADILTKSLAGEHFKELRKKLMGW